MKRIFLLIFLLSNTVAWAHGPCEGELSGKALAKWEEARALGLHQARPENFTFTRKSYRGGFRYFDRNGKQITNPTVIARLEDLNIRKDLKDVHISNDPLSHIKAYGVDAAKRTQRIYTDLWIQARDTVKFEHMVDFGMALPTIRAAAASDFKKREVSKTRVLAAIVLLLDETHIRIGNSRSATKNESFGLTTMQKSHVDVDVSRVSFDFVGKSGRRHKPNFEDAGMARFIEDLRNLPGKSLFQYVAEDGDIRAITAAEVNAYLGQISGEDITAKEFRTWAATVAAVDYLHSAPRPATFKAASEAAAEVLENTADICRSSYIHPAVFTLYAQPDQWNVAFRGASRSGLSEMESATLRLLKN